MGAWYPSLAEIEAARLDGPNHARRRAPTVPGVLVLTALALALGMAVLVWFERQRDDEVIDDPVAVLDHDQAPSGETD